jgi:chemotaxis protein CheX
VDAKYINPFIQSFHNVMPQIGFTSVNKGAMSVKNKDLISIGVMIIVGIVGDVKGNVVYTATVENAKKIASTMMMGMPVNELNEMSQSALSELANMLTANAATCFSNIGIEIDISTPTLIYGQNFSTKMSSSTVLCVELQADNIQLEINIALENK